MILPDTSMSTDTKEKLDSISEALCLMELDNFVIFKAKGCTVTRDLDSMSDAEKLKLIDALMWREDGDMYD